MNTDSSEKPTIIGYNNKKPLEQSQNDQLPTTNDPLKILLVDDKWQNRIFLVELLTNLGFSVLEANNGKEALDLALENRPELILTDLVMPLMDGFELTRQIRQSAQLKNIVVIAASANVFENQQHQSQLAGCNEFIAKPINTKKLLDLLQKYLPLEWQYDNAEKQSTLPNQKPAATTVPMTGPNFEQASILFKIIMSGNIKKIIENVTQLEQQDAKLAAFAKEVNRLAKRFEMSKLKKLINPYIS